MFYIDLTFFLFYLFILLFIDQNEIKRRWRRRIRNLHFCTRWWFPNAFTSYQIGIHYVLGFWFDDLNPLSSNRQKVKRKKSNNMTYEYIYMYILIFLFFRFFLYKKNNNKRCFYLSPISFFFLSLQRYV